jgi:tRNA (guanine9-N1)-methyltransferase
LPIGDYIKLASRKVLTVNQVFEIMVKWLDCRDWEKAFMEIIPERKLKESTFIKQGQNNSDEEEDEEEELVTDDQSKTDVNNDSIEESSSKP